MLKRRRNSIARWRCCTPSNSITPFKDSTQRSKVIRLAESRTGESRSAPVEQSVRGWHEGQQPATGGTRERRTGQSRWRKNGARTSVHRGRRQSVRQLREHTTASTFARLSRCDGKSRVKIFRRSGGADFLRASACSCGRANRQDLRRAAQGRRDPGETIPGRTGPSRAGALHHSHLRRAVSGGKGPYRRAALFRYRA
jgi:hypothetical protein